MEKQTFANQIPAQKPSGFKGKVTLSEGIDLEGKSVRCDSEDGELKKVLVHPPDFLSWTKQTAINHVQKTHMPPSISQVKEEHDMLVNALSSEGAEVIS